MNRLFATFLLLLFPGLVLADSALSFAPPASDYSVVFLGNLFGVVDGVLSGTGSQIMGSMFGVFNAAVLALGGIIIMYTLIVSTMNTAHEGQMLGQKWSSIWIPIRSTIGLALLIPKASGYCIMQIFVMWVVVQGIGAADKVWDAALSYLNRGGVIIQAQQINPGQALINAAQNQGISGVAAGAINILTGQVCMLGLQTKLQMQRQFYLNAQSKGSGPCSNAAQGSAMQQFCNTPVPDFIGTVNAVVTQSDTQSQNPQPDSWTVDMPHFKSTSPYAFLNGICGSIQWNNIKTLNSDLGSMSASPGTTASVGKAISSEDIPTFLQPLLSNIVGKQISLSPSEVQTIQMSRAIAVQQMYMDLAGVARTIIDNDPQMSTTSNTNQTSPYNLVANQQFGVPYTKNGQVCASYDKTCVVWGPASGSTGGGTLFNGTELINAINDYNGIMMPTLNLARLITNVVNAGNATDFINDASTQGWLMAGSYFFNLVQIQGSARGESGRNAIKQASQTDSSSGLDGSTSDATTILKPFTIGANNNVTCSEPYSDLCTWFGGDIKPVKQIQALISGTQITADANGNPVTSEPLPKPTPSSFSSTTQIDDSYPSSTAYGFIHNALMMQTPGQPGTAKLNFANQIKFQVDTDLYRLKTHDFDCGPVKILFFEFCLGWLLGNLFYNLIIVTLYNLFLDIFGQFIQQVVMAFIMIPLTGMADIFKQGVDTLSEPGVNPIVALANMGNQYINFSGNVWQMMFTMSMIPFLNVIILPMMAIGLPIIFAWLAVMVSVGFVTAYYIPILPYLIFTFGALGWLISVIEAMVAAPIVALGITHPEGHEAFGKGEHAIMILVNVFLRPSMMIIGYIAAIALSYVGVWILNAGYDQAISFMQGESHALTLPAEAMPKNSYTDWAGIYAFFFSILTYTTLYLVIVQKAFTLITYLPDKVLRWIGGAPESIGQEAVQWGEEVKGQAKEGAGKVQEAQGQVDKALGGYGAKALDKLGGAMGQGGGGGGVKAQGTNIGPNSTPDDGKGGKKGGGNLGSSGGKKPPVSK